MKYERNMSNLEEYIRQNREAFEDQELPDGSLERFERRLEILRFAQDDLRGAQDDWRGAQDDWRGAQDDSRKISWAAVAGWAVTVAAAIAAVVIFIGRTAPRHEDWFAGIGDDQREICQAYYGKMAEFYETILAEDFDDARLADLEDIVSESVPMVDQLPEELDPGARAAILKEYYGSLLDGMERLNNSVSY